MDYFGDAVIIRNALPVTKITTTGQILIFSLLNVPKKTATVIACVAIGVVSIWGLSMWQDISLPEILNLLLACVLMLGSIIVAALLLIAVFKLLGKAIKKLTTSGKN